jgi:hypothetical protein
MMSASRKNVSLALVVEQGLLIDMIRGSANAWAYMAMNDVPPQVIQRVLIDPARRRPSISAAAKAQADIIRADEQSDDTAQDDSGDSAARQRSR